MPSINPDLSLNMLAGEIQVVDLVSKGQVGRASKKGAQPSQESLSVTYALQNRTSLPSRSDRQLIQIAARPMGAKFYKVATPVLTSYVYEEASVVNEGTLVLLAGPVATYFAGQFVGHGQIPTVTTGEEFTVGLGIDSALRAGRELVERTETIQGGNRVVDFTYRLTLENFAGKATQVRLFDRLPTGRKSELTVSQLAAKYDLSEEEAYEQGERKKGILRWDLEVPAQVSGLQALGVEYQFRLEYDKQMTLAGMPGERK